MQKDARQVVTPISVALSSSSGQNLNNNQHVLTWEDAVSADILPVRCKDTNAELHKSKFGSGNKGKCIRSGDVWYTPTEFEAICGRGNSKDWKRSIRFGGRTLQTLIDKKFLIPHASSCICSNCVDNATATGPIRPFTTYQRKRKNKNNKTGKNAKVERLTSKDSATDESSDIGTSPVGSAGIGSLTHALMKITNEPLPTNNADAWKTMEDAVEKLVSAGTVLKTMLQEMKERTTQEAQELSDNTESLQEALNQVRQQQSTVTISRNLEPQILRIFDSNRIQTYSIEVLDPETFRQLEEGSAHPSPSSSPKDSPGSSNAVLPPISQMF